MPSVTINEKGIVSESGSGFAVNDGPLLPSLETYTGSASIEISCALHDDRTDNPLDEGDAGYLNDLGGKYFTIADAAGNEYHVYFDIDDANAGAGAGQDDDPEATDNAVVIAKDADALMTPTAVAAEVATAINALDGFTATSADEVVTVKVLSMGKVAASLSRGTLGDLGDDGGNEFFSVSLTQPTAAVDVAGALPATENTLAGHGVSVLGTSADADALTVALAAGTGAGVKKTLVSSGWQAGTITVAATMRHTGTRAQNASTLTFNSASDHIMLAWNSSDALWEVVVNSSVAIAN